jgi:ATP-dependent Clp protease ATP-binding subunit ClpB
MASRSEIARHTSASGLRDNEMESSSLVGTDKGDIMFAEVRKEPPLSKPPFFLDHRVKCQRAQEFDDKLATRIIGQKNAIRGMGGLYQLFLAGLNQTNRPVGTLLFLGPTGSGKTKVVEAAAEVLFGDANAVIKIDCGEFQHSHEIAKLIGSPPGYLGHRETSPLLSQENLDRFKTEETPLSLVLFDEIEKASDALWMLLLGILDKGTLTLGDNRRVDFSRCVIVMTSNLGAREMSGWIDKVVVFHSLNEQHLRQILELELCALQERILRSANTKFVFQCSAEVKEMLLREGIDYRYGARHLKRSIERLLVLPISNLVATGQVEVGDSVYVDLDDVAFSKRHDTATSGDLCVPEGEVNPFYGAPAQSQQLAAMA